MWLAAPIGAVGEIGPLPKDHRVILEPLLAELLAAVNEEFRQQASRMPRLSRQLLIELVEPSTVDPGALLSELRLPANAHEAAISGLSMAGSAAVLQREAALSRQGCAALRAAVDADQSSDRCQRPDSVDGGPDHQLNLSREQLESLVGASSAAALFALPSEFSASSLDGAAVQVFVRRYAARERPWTPFHVDSAAVTVNVALQDDGLHGGGALLACYGGAVVRIKRRAGDATVHESTLLHGVSMTTSGVRYSLVIFVGSNHVSKDDGELGGLASAAAEAETLHALMADDVSGSFLARCVEAHGEAQAEALRRNYAEVCDETDDVGVAVERVVAQYGAPHLRPTNIWARVGADASVAGQGTADAAGGFTAYWSVRTLLRYLRA